MDPCNDQNFCVGLVQGLSGGNLKGLGLDSGGDRFGSSNKSDIKDVRKMGERVLRLFNSSIKIINIIFYLSNHVFLCLQILRHFDNYLEDPP